MSQGSMPFVTRHVIYHGRVQGVGFRVAARQAARDYPISGSVRNLPNGTVEVIVQGATGEVEQFLQALAHRFSHNLDQVEELPATQDVTWQGFVILE